MLREGEEKPRAAAAASSSHPEKQVTKVIMR
jgi:hypothetical protein